jgi:hypothetical protein
MKVKIYNQPSDLIGKREISGVKRWYYTHRLYPRLLMVSHSQSMNALQGKIGICLFDQPDSTIVCDVLPDAPQWWRGVKLTQCSIKLVRRLPKGPDIPLSEVLALKQKEYGYGRLKLQAGEGGSDE